MTHTLHTPPGSHLAFKALIAAEYNSIPLQITDFTDPTLSPTSTGPILTTPHGTLFESNAIARYIAKLRPDTGLIGTTPFEEALIDGWIDFASNVLDRPGCDWICPVMGWKPFDEKVYRTAKEEFAAGLTVLNANLEGKSFLVGDRMTLADIAAVSALVYPFKFVCDGGYLAPFGNVVRWFLNCVGRLEFKAVIGECVICRKEMLAKGQSAENLMQNLTIS